MIRFLLLPLFIALVGLGVFALITENPDGFEAYEQGDYGVAREALTPVAEDGNAEAQYILGQIYEQGLGVPKDPDMALKWYRLAADQGHRQSLVKLSEIINQKLGQGSDSTAKDTTTTTDKNDNDLGDNLPVVEMDADKSPETGTSKTDVDQQGGESNQPDLTPEKTTETATETDPDKEATGGVLEMLVSLFDGRNISNEENTDVPADTKKLVNQQSLSENNLKTGPKKETPPEVMPTEVISGEMAGSLVDGRQAFKSELYEQALKILLPHAIKGNAEAQYRVGEMYRKALDVPGDEKKGLAWIRKAAEQGHAEAQYVLGFSYQHAIGKENNSRKALSWLQLAADQGHLRALEALEDLDWLIDLNDTAPKTSLTGLDAEFESAKTAFEEKEFDKGIALLKSLARQDYTQAQFELGWAYVHGAGVGVDKVEGLRLLEIAGNKENLQAQFSLGFLYYLGVKVPRDQEKSAFWFKRSYSNGDTKSLYYLGDLYSAMDDTSDNQKEALHWFQLSAKEEGDRESQRRLAEIYSKGIGVKPDPGVAVKWLKLAAEQGDRDAQYNLGLNYEEGVGIPKDVVQARRWYRHAANQDLPLAINRLAELNDNYPEQIKINQEDFYREFYRGVGAFEQGMPYGAQDIWLNLAKLGHVRSQFRLGMTYLPTLKRDEDGGTWVKRAAEQGYSHAQHVLGEFYAYGIRGFSQDLDKSLEWYKKSADQGYEPGVYAYARSYLEEQGIPKDEKKYINILEHYATQDVPIALKILGFHYERGDLVSKDLSRATDLYQRAADLGDEQAMKDLLRVQNEGKVGSDAVQTERETQNDSPDNEKPVHKPDNIPAGQDLEQVVKTAPEIGKKIEKKEAAKQKETSREAKIESDSDNEAVYRLMMLSFRMEDYEMAIATGLPLAEAGDLEAQILMSNIYANKNPPDYDEAFKWASRAAETGDGPALTLLASHYMAGKGVARDFEKAYELNKSAVAQKDPRAHLGLAMQYHHGLGVSQDFKSAEKYYKKAVEMGETDAYFPLGEMYENGDLGARNLARAQHYYALAAKAGDQEAEAILEELRAVLSSIPKPKRKPDNIPARPVPKQIAKETTIIKRQDKGTFSSSSSSGSLAASMEKYKELYAAGDYGKALEILHPFVEANNPQALYLMGDMYFRGLGVERDTKQAFYLFKRSAKSGYSKAQAQVAFYYMVGSETPEDLEKAQDWALKSAVQGDAKGQEIMGLVLEKKDKGKKGMGKAVKWFRLAAKQGSLDAQSLLGLALISLDPRDEEGWMWLHIATIRGDKSAKSAVDRSKKYFSESILAVMESVARTCIHQNYQNCE